jgi:hypothetical protein
MTESSTPPRIPGRFIVLVMFVAVAIVGFLIWRAAR